MPTTDTISQMRVAITGGPRTGKTTLAATIGGGEVRHTDELVGKLEWSEASAEVAKWLDEPGPWVIEGVAVSRALRKWRDAHPGEKPPIDRVIFLTKPREFLSLGQKTMAKGVRTVHNEIEPWLKQHGIVTEYQ